MSASSDAGGARTRVVGAFADAAAARRALDTLRAAGVADDAITIADGAPISPPPKREREGRFMGRLVLIVAAWSVVGTGVGAVMGLIFSALSIGPAGSSGLLLQVVSWALFAHLISGMWAGYALLTTGESREPVRHIAGGRTVVSVWCDDPVERERASSALRDAGASAIAAYDAEGRRTDAGV